MNSPGTMTAEGRTTIPKAIREALGLEPGTAVEWRLDGDRAILTPRRPLSTELAGRLGGDAISGAELEERLARALRDDDERIKASDAKMQG